MLPLSKLRAAHPGNRTNRTKIPGTVRTTNLPCSRRKRGISYGSYGFVRAFRQLSSYYLHVEQFLKQPYETVRTVRNLVETPCQRHFLSGATARTSRTKPYETVRRARRGSERR